METEDRAPDLLWADRIVAGLAGVATILPFALVAALTLARIAAQTAGTGGPTGRHPFGWAVPSVMLAAGVALAALAFGGCRGLWRGRRSGFVIAGALSLLSLPLAFVLAPFPLGGSDIPVAPPTAFLILALAVAAYARLRLTVVGPTPI